MHAAQTIGEIMNDENRQPTDLSRRRFLTNTVAASAVGFGVGAAKATEAATSTVRRIPELAPQWKKLDLTEILSRPAAFVSISQNKSLYETWGLKVRRNTASERACRRP